jgi:hypothetical protein
MQRQGIFHYISIIYHSEPIKRSLGRRRPDFARIYGVMWYMERRTAGGKSVSGAGSPRAMKVRGGNKWRQDEIDFYGSAFFQ